MNNLFCFRWKNIAVLLGCLLLAACAHGPQTIIEAPPGGKVEQDWKGLIDSFALVQDFNLADYKQIVIEPLDTSSTPMPPKDDNTFEPTALVLKISSDIFVSGMKTSFRDAKYPMEVSLAVGKSRPEGKTLIVRGKVTEMDPGSKALRYWVSFGAGKSRVEIAGEVVDAESNKTLVRFVHARASGIGVWGGDYQKFLTDDTQDVGEDVGKMLLYFDKSRDRS